MELQRSLKTSIRNTYEILGSGGDIFSRKGRFSSSLSADLEDEDIAIEKVWKV